MFGDGIELEGSQGEKSPEPSKEDIQIFKKLPNIQAPSQIVLISLPNQNLFTAILIDEFETPYCRVIIEKSVLKEFIKIAGELIEEGEKDANT